MVHGAMRAPTSAKAFAAVWLAMQLWSLSTHYALIAGIHRFHAQLHDAYADYCFNRFSDMPSCQPGVQDTGAACLPCAGNSSAPDFQPKCATFCYADAAANGTTRCGCFTASTVTVDESREAEEERRSSRWCNRMRRVSVCCPAVQRGTETPAQSLRLCAPVPRTLREGGSDMVNAAAVIAVIRTLLVLLLVYEKCRHLNHQAMAMQHGVPVPSTALTSREIAVAAFAILLCDLPKMVLSTVHIPALVAPVPSIRALCVRSPLRSSLQFCDLTVFRASFGLVAAFTSGYMIVWSTSGVIFTVAKQSRAPCWCCTALAMSLVLYFFAPIATILAILVAQFALGIPVLSILWDDLTTNSLSTTILLAMLLLLPTWLPLCIGAQYLLYVVTGSKQPVSLYWSERQLRAQVEASGAELAIVLPQPSANDALNVPLLGVAEQDAAKLPPA